MQSTIAGRNPPRCPSLESNKLEDQTLEELNPSQPVTDNAENAPEQPRHSANSHLRKRGLARLRKALCENFVVFPNGSCPSLPELTISVKDMIHHIQSQIKSVLGAQVASNSDGERTIGSVEIYGGVARAIVAADVGEEVLATDFDVRFYIGCLGFDFSRQLVEEYLLKQVASKLEPASPQPNVGLVRYSYFQKQVVIGSWFSLLSFGNPATGKNVDIEFCPSRGGIRNYFDNANAFVIPLSDSILRRRGQCTTAEAVCLSGSFNDAVNLLLRKELVIQDPMSVVNGLTLYTHTLCVKGLTPRTSEDEGFYGRRFVETFIAEARRSKGRGGDPLRFVRSFIRSHYTAEPLSALAMAAQLSALLLGFGSLSPDDVVWLSLPLGELMSSAAIVALHHANGEADAMQAIHCIVRFAVSPHGHGNESAVARTLPVPMGTGREIRLLRLPVPDVDTSSVVSMAAARLDVIACCEGAVGGLVELSEVLREPPVLWPLPLMVDDHSMRVASATEEAAGAWEDCDAGKRAAELDGVEKAEFLPPVDDGMRVTGNPQLALPLAVGPDGAAAGGSAARGLQRRPRKPVRPRDGRKAREEATQKSEAPDQSIKGGAAQEPSRSSLSGAGARASDGKAGGKQRTGRRGRGSDR